MSGLFRGAKVDLWEALENVDDATGDVSSASHDPTYKDVVAQLVPFSSREKLTSGIDVSARMKRLYIEAGRVSDLSNDAVVVDVTNSRKPEYWTVESEVEVYDTHLECILAELTEPVDMIGQYYG